MAPRRPRRGDDRCGRLADVGAGRSQQRGSEHDVATGQPRGSRPRGVGGPELALGEGRLYHGLRRRHEADRLAAGAHRLQEARGLARQQDEVRERRRVLERLQQGILALLRHRLRRLDDEDAPLALERPVGDRGDDARANLLDEVLGPGRRDPRQVGMGRRHRDGAASNVVGTRGPGGE
jgi:hypothetical protein